MPKLTIDNLDIEVPEGTKVIEAAERLGIMIPRFCYHPALGSVGACRVCAVSFLEGPVKGIKMSCMENAKDGMVVSTTDPEAVAFRKYVIEWLLLNHPHDCPVCDEGGHCLLQDQTVSGGHGLRRYMGKKRTYRDQDLGPFVQHEMNRCIHCFRCRRFYQDYAGYRDLGAMQIGNRTYFGRFCDGPLESPFSGNLIDVCPTGVYTDKPARFKGRRWDFERGPSLCLHCSLGCNTMGSARYRAMVRQEARVNGAVNGTFICDRGRFSFDFANRPDRPRRARVQQVEVPWEEGIRTAAESLNRVCREAGPEAIACLGSTRCSLESQGALKRFCRMQGWPDPRFFLDPAMAIKVKKAVSRLDARLAVSMAEIEEADFILAIGADPVNEAPMLALAMRQAYRRGAPVVLIDPRPLSLPFAFEHLAVSPGNLEACLSTVVRKAVSRDAAGRLGAAVLEFYDALPAAYASDRGFQDRLDDVAKKMRECQRPGLICGTDIVRETTPGLAADLAHLIKAMVQWAGVFYLLPGPNAFGAALLSPAKEPAPLIDAIEKGQIKALLLVESDPFWLYPDQGRLLKALDKLDLLLVMDYLPSQSVERAHIVLPTITVFEGTASSFVNQEGRLQVASPVHGGGTPIAQVSVHKHPPRIFLQEVPGGEPKTPAAVFRDLSTTISGQGDGFSGDELMAWLIRENSAFEGLLHAPDPTDSRRLLQQERTGEDFTLWETSQQEGEETLHESLELLFVDRTYGTEELSSYSGITPQVETFPKVHMHREDAARLGLSAGDRVSLKLDGVSLELELHVSESMARGVVVLPRHGQPAGHGIRNWRMTVPSTSIKRCN